MVRDASKLQVFGLAHQLALDVYRLSNRLPASERFGLTSQLRRAALSVPANIVEGCNRRTAKEYDRFIEIALGSAAELRYLLRFISDLGLLPLDALEHCSNRSDRVVKTLQNLQRAVGRFNECGVGSVEGGEARRSIEGR